MMRVCPCRLLLVSVLVLHSTLVHSTVMMTSKVRTLPAFAASCNFLCYSGILSETDGCTCHKKMCVPSSCHFYESCQTTLIKQRAVAVCCPRDRHTVCNNRPRFHARRGRRAYYFRPETKSCHRFSPTKFDPKMYFRSYRDCVRSCSCRLASRRRPY